MQSLDSSPGFFPHTVHIRQTGSKYRSTEYRQHQSTVTGVLADLRRPDPLLLTASR